MPVYKDKIQTDTDRQSFLPEGCLFIYLFMGQGGRGKKENSHTHTHKSIIYYCILETWGLRLWFLCFRFKRHACQI